MAPYLNVEKRKNETLDDSIHEKVAAIFDKFIRIFSRSTIFAFFLCKTRKIAFCSGALLEFLHVDDYTGRPLSEKDEKWSC